MNTGELIKEFRKKIGITQKELGQLVGMTYQQIAQYERGTRNPKKETIEKIAKALKIDPYSLYSFDIESEELAELINSKDRNEDKLLDNYRELNDIGQDKAIELVELLTKIPEYKANILKSKEVILKLDKDGNFTNPEKKNPAE